MPAFYADFTLYSLDGELFKTFVKKFVEQEMRKAVKDFLKAVLVRIPVRTGFLKGAFSLVNEAFNPEASPDLNPILSSLLRAHTQDIGGKRVNINTAELFKQREALRDAKLSREGHLKRESTLRASSRKAFTRQMKILNEKRKRYGLPRNKSSFKEYYYFGGKKILKTPKSGIPFVTKPEDVLTVDESGRIVFFLDVRIIYYRVNDFYSKGHGTPWGSLNAGAAAMANRLERILNKFPKITELLTTIRIGLRGSKISVTKDNSHPQQLVKSRFFSIKGF